MASYVNFFSSIPADLRTINLARELKVKVPQALGWYACLLAGAVEYALSGVLSPEAVAYYSKYEGKHDFVQALTKSGLAHRTDEGIELADWESLTKGFLKAEADRLRLKAKRDAKKGPVSVATPPFPRLVADASPTRQVDGRTVGRTVRQDGRSVGPTSANAPPSPGAAGDAIASKVEEKDRITQDRKRAAFVEIVAGWDAARVQREIELLDVDPERHDQDLAEVIRARAEALVSAVPLNGAGGAH